jgi:hypothetical protein
MRQAVKKMKEREVFVAHISPQETDGREREGEREIFAHMYLEEADGGEREMGSLLLLLLPLSAPGLACSAIKAVTTTTAPTKSLFWCSSKSPDDDDHHHHPRPTQE